MNIHDWVICTMAFLEDIKKFSDTGKLNHVDTIVTTTDGKRVSV